MSRGTDGEGNKVEEERGPRLRAHLTQTPPVCIPSWPKFQTTSSLGIFFIIYPITTIWRFSNTTSDVTAQALKVPREY
jgi:hypothetical protein